VFASKLGSSKCCHKSGSGKNNAGQRYVLNLMRCYQLGGKLCDVKRVGMSRVKWDCAVYFCLWFVDFARENIWCVIKMWNWITIGWRICLRVLIKYVFIKTRSVCVGSGSKKGLIHSVDVIKGDLRYFEADLINSETTLHLSSLFFTYQPALGPRGGLWPVLLISN
jgi:hypothetical protein